MEENRFDQLADDTLKALTHALDELGEELDVELANGILNVGFAQGGVPYVINSHRAARQIWLAAEQRAAHFGYDEASRRWLDTKTGVELFDHVEAQLTGRLGRPVKLARPAK